MKTLLFVLLIIFASCEKDSQCWTCQIRTVRTVTNVISDNTVIRDQCDFTTDEILMFESENNKQWTEIVINNLGNPVNVKVKQTCECKIKI